LVSIGRLVPCCPRKLQLRARLWNILPGLKLLLLEKTLSQVPAIIPLPSIDTAHPARAPCYMTLLFDTYSSHPFIFLTSAVLLPSLVLKFSSFYVLFLAFQICATAFRARARVHRPFYSALLAICFIREYCVDIAWPGPLRCTGVSF
jgi:hypothetical protein